MAGRRRLDQVDAMRPLKQVGVVSTHSIITFAPAAAAVLSNATLLLLHVSREVFFFISACMLTYAYTGLKRDGWRKFYWRRFVTVGVPYLTNRDRKSTRLNSSHSQISYAVFCLKKKKKTTLVNFLPL